MTLSLSTSILPSKILYLNIYREREIYTMNIGNDYKFTT